MKELWILLSNVFTKSRKALAVEYLTDFAKDFSSNEYKRVTGGKPAIHYTACIGGHEGSHRKQLDDRLCRGN